MLSFVSELSTNALLSMPSAVPIVLSDAKGKGEIREFLRKDGQDRTKLQKYHNSGTPSPRGGSGWGSSLRKHLKMRPLPFAL